MLCFHQFHFPKVTWEVESNHSSFFSYIYPNWPVNWVDVVGGCYGVVLEHGSPIRLDGQCVGHLFMLFSFVLIVLMVYVCVSYAWSQSWLWWCHRVKDDIVVVKYVIMSVWLVTCCLCLCIVSIHWYGCCCHAWGHGMCSWYGHALMAGL